MHDKLDLASMGLDAKHACDDQDCPVVGVRNGDLGQLGYAMSVFYDAPESMDTVVFTGADGLYVLLVTKVNGQTAVVGALYTPNLYQNLRDCGYTHRESEETGGVN